MRYIGGMTGIPKIIREEGTADPGGHGRLLPVKDIRLLADNEPSITSPRRVTSAVRNRGRLLSANVDLWSAFHI
jgi:hypothetical protein